MADTRCPMCGKLNPQEADACRYCGARLKPLQPGGSKPSAPAAPPGGGEGDAEWMADLRGDMMRNRPKTSMLPPEPPAPPPPSDDWLRKIDSSGEAKSAPPSAASAKAGTTRRSVPPVSIPPAKTETPGRSAAPPPPPQEGGAEPPAWLSKVRTQVSKERQVAPPPAPQNVEEEPVWLKRLRARRTQDDLASTSPSELQPEAAAPGELPDWLSKIREKTTGEDEQLGGQDQSFLASPLSGAAPAPPSGGRGESPWGKPAPAQKPRAAEPAPPKATDSEVPDWMKYPSDAGDLPGAEPPIGTPDWMGSITSALEETPPVPPPPAPGAPSRTGGLTGRPSTSRLLGGADAAEPGSSRGPGQGPASKAKRISQPTHPFTEPPSPTPASSAFGPDWEFPAGSAPDFPFPNPAADVSFPSPSAAFSAGTEPMVSPGGEEEMPDWLADAQRAPAAPAPEIEDESPTPTPDLNELLRPDAMPEWLRKPAGTGAKEKDGEAAKAVPGLPENLEQAELPRWLEAMRPIQSVAVPTEDEERVESVGPLAGLRGVLSAEPVVAMPRRPGIMAGNIDSMPAQQSLTETLRRLLIEPEVRAAHRPVRAMLLTPIIRKVMSGVLIIAILMPLLTGPIFSTSVYQPQANIQAGQLMTALPVDRMVLVAFEYDASSAPEIETGATVLLEHLAQRGIGVVFISTQPNGTMLGDGLLLQNKKMGMSIPSLVSDFGYIPGGAGGLRRLTGNLRDVIHNPQPDWSTESLAAIQSISDFSMILILAASPQSVRDWVEQVHTAAPNTPIVAMVSAASDALVFPYTQGSNPAIRGLVTGYTGAQAYRVNFLPSTVPVEGVYAMRWQAFASGTLALLLTLAAGIIGSLVLGFIRKDRKGAE